MIDIKKFTDSLDEQVASMRREQLRQPASAIAANATLGAAALVLNSIARAIEAAKNPPDSA